MTTNYLAAVATAAALTVAASSGAATAKDCTVLQTQSEMTMCAADNYAASDAKLNATYKTLMAKLADATQQGYLRDAQRAWVTYRDKECVLRTGGGPDQGGTIWPMIYADCLMTLTDERIKDLAALIECPGGDLSC